MASGYSIFAFKDGADVRSRRCGRMARSVFGIRTAAFRSLLRGTMGQKKIEMTPLPAFDFRFAFA